MYAQNYKKLSPNILKIDENKIEKAHLFIEEKMLRLSINQNLNWKIGAKRPV